MIPPKKHGRRAAIPNSVRPPAPVSRESGSHRAAHATTNPTPRATRARGYRRRSAPTRHAFSVLAMTFAGGLMLATSVPALAIAPLGLETHASVSAPGGDSAIDLVPQSVDVGSEVNVSALASGGYAVEAAPPPVIAEVATLESVAVADSSAIAWPVLYPDRISDPFGPRDAPCSGCSTVHDGVDMNSGDGTPVMSIADGVVISSTDAGGGFGVMIEVEHNIGGEVITSLYAHLQYGSRLAEVGDRVTVGQEIGAIGSTGQSTGPHLHLEMFGADGVRFDGFAWLSARIG
jgi:murein DD-endopeptidase MepM/ murein hydrolase activator NlpD